MTPNAEACFMGPAYCRSLLHGPDLRGVLSVRDLQPRLPGGGGAHSGGGGGPRSGGGDRGGGHPHR
eukprot:8051189-Pyramimonas_sp.AAC.1